MTKFSTHSPPYSRLTHKDASLPLKLRRCYETKRFPPIAAFGTALLKVGVHGPPASDSRGEACESEVSGGPLQVTHLGLPGMQPKATH